GCIYNGAREQSTSEDRGVKANMRPAIMFFKEELEVVKITSSESQIVVKIDNVRTTATSEVVAINLRDYIEADECVDACGVDRKSVGISSDTFLDSQFTAKLCSPQCYQNCPNIVDLYYNLALGEGAFLCDLCKSQRANSRLSMAQIQSFGAALGPISAAAGPMSAASPSPSPSSSLDCASAQM
ncbi:uncharacterized protein LOC111383176, partial [Olea europaea var. sylvestris]|uniref:uncharacterized protein LOC111383176 n=1 Tax=Olea europaea var. sylvestris TaxID=158386 RepID=UPI000C1D47BF